MSNFQVVKSTKSLLLSRSAINNSIIHVQLNTPSNLNALTVEMGEEFNTLMTELSSDTSIRAMILSGSGRAFSAGGDLKFLYERSKISAPKNVESMVKNIYLKINFSVNSTETSCQFETFRFRQLQL